MKQHFPSMDQSLFLRGMNTPDFSPRLESANSQTRILLYHNRSSGSNFEYDIDIGSSELRVRSDTDISTFLEFFFKDGAPVNAPFLHGIDVHTFRCKPLPEGRVYLSSGSLTLGLDHVEYR